jgi:hypothetical protein
MDVSLLHNKPSYPAHAGYPVRRSFSAPSLTPRSTGSLAGACHRAARRADLVAGDDGWGCGAFAFNQTQPRDLAAQCARAIDLSLAPQRGRGECRMPAAPAVSCAITVVERTRVTTSTPASPGIPARNGFTTYFALSPVTGLFCHRRPRTNVVSAPGRADTTSANLTPASGRQDHTTSPYATTSLVRVLLIAHRPKPALQSRRTQNAAASTASAPRVRDDRDTPLVVGWDGANL